MTMKRWLTFVVAASLLCGGVAQAQVARSQFNGTVTDSAGGVFGRCHSGYYLLLRMSSSSFWIGVKSIHSGRLIRR